MRQYGENGKHKKRINVYLEPIIEKRLNDMAIMMNMSKSSLVAQLIQHQVNYPEHGVIQVRPSENKEDIS